MDQIIGVTMKTTKYTFFTFILFLSSLVFTTLLAQVEEKPKIDEKAEVNNPNSIEANGNKIEFKNETTNSILTITDEGNSAGSIELKDINGVSANTKKLLNEDGNLTWDGDPLGSGSGWTTSGNNVYNSGYLGKVGINTNNPLSPLSVNDDGEANTTIFAKNPYYGGRAIKGWATGAGGFGGYFLGRGYFRNNVGIGSGIDNPQSLLSVGSNGTSIATIFTLTELANGISIRGRASATGNVENYGGFFSSDGNQGRGVYGLATAGGNVQNYGGYFSANGNQGSGVYGISNGLNGRGVTGFTSSISGVGVYGEAEAAGTNNENHGGSFLARGYWGRGVNAVATGAQGRGVVAAGNAFDFLANGAGTDFGTLSSIRWKKNIREIDNPLEKLEQIRGVYYSWDEEHGGQHAVGMIAEEVGKVLPEIVEYEENGIDAIGMDYSKLTPLLVEVAKAQQKKIEELEEKLSKIENLLNGKRFTSADN